MLIPLLAAHAAMHDGSVYTCVYIYIYMCKCAYICKCVHIHKYA